MAMNSAPSVDEGWSPEPELLEPTPRHFEPVFEYPDHNKPKVLLFCVIGGVIATVGFVLFGMGMGKHHTLMQIQGVLLAIVGAALLVVFPRKGRNYELRARNMIENGRPMMANLLTSENLTGDSTYGRSIKYQVVMPGGELVHKTVNADERRLPKRIPGKATVLVDVQAHDVELYCVLPYRAILTGASAAAASAPISPMMAPPVSAPLAPPPGLAITDPLASQPKTTQPAGSGQMGTLDAIRPTSSAPAPPKRRAYEPTQILDVKDIPLTMPPDLAPSPPAPPAPPPAAPAATTPPAAQPETPAPADERLPWE